MMKNGFESARDKYDEIVLSLCKTMRDRMLKDLEKPDNVEGKETWKEEAQLKYADDCSRLERLLKIHDDRELTKYVISTADSLNKSLKLRRCLLAGASIVLSALIIAWTVWFGRAFFANVTPVLAICFLGIETFAACLLYALLNYLFSAKNSSMNTAQVLEHLVSLERSRLEPEKKEQEDVLLQLVRKLYTDQ